MIASGYKYIFCEKVYIHCRCMHEQILLMEYVTRKVWRPLSQTSFGCVYRRGGGMGMFGSSQNPQTEDNEVQRLTEAVCLILQRPAKMPPPPGSLPCLPRHNSSSLIWAPQPRVPESQGPLSLPQP